MVADTMYGTEACQLDKSELNSFDFATNRFLMKLFKTSKKNNNWRMSWFPRNIFANFVNCIKNKLI